LAGAVSDLVAYTRVSTNGQISTARPSAALEPEILSAPVAEALQSLSDGQLFERRAAAMKMLPDTISGSEARRRVWDVIYLLDEEIRCR
jgi:hypothetical protein